MPETLLDRLNQAGRRSDRYLQVVDERLSYAELWTRARSWAACLRGQGLSDGDRVAILAGTSLDTVTALVAVWLAGGAPVCLPTPPRLGRAQDYRDSLTRHLAACRPRLGLCEADPPCSEPALPGGWHRLPLDPGEGELPSSVAPDSLALVQFSSGTTVAPRPVALTHANLVANTRSILEVFPGHPQDHSCVSWLPLYHDMGLIGSLLTALVAQGDLYLMRPLQFVARPLSWLHLLSRTRATVSPAPNFALNHCCARSNPEELEGLDLSNWQLALIGSEMVQPRVLDRFLEQFSPYGLRREALTPVYGLAEATLAVTFSPPGRGIRCLDIDTETLMETGRIRPGAGRRVVSVGVPLPGVELEIRDEQGRPLGERCRGRVFTRGASVMAGYLALAGSSSPPLVPASAVGSAAVVPAALGSAAVGPAAVGSAAVGSAAVGPAAGPTPGLGPASERAWLDTGDLGFLDQGELYLLGRAKDVVILNGRNHDPEAIEQSIPDLPGQAAAFSVEDEARGSERLIVLVEQDRARSDPQILAREARQAVNERTGLLAEVHVVPAGRLPRTSSGKVRRGAARDDFLEGRLSGLL